MSANLSNVLENAPPIPGIPRQGGFYVSWQTKTLTVASLHLDHKNPRLGRETTAKAPREIIQYLFDFDDAIEVAGSIARAGYFPNEPLLVVEESGKSIVVEGNRRLAALKALREPGLLEGKIGRQVERLSRMIADRDSIKRVPVTIAPSRRATDRQVATRHGGTPVRAWRAENRASFILEKLEEGYDNNQLRDDLGYTLADIQQARQTRALAEMARSLDLPEEVSAKLESPKAKLFTTLERVFDSSVGREYLKVEPDPDHGLRGKTTREEFVKGFTRLVTDLVLGKESSRTLNSNENIRVYFQKWGKRELPKNAKGTFVPADVIQGKSVASLSSARVVEKPVRGKSDFITVLPKSLKVRIDNPRLIDLRTEMVRLNRKQFPNAGAVLMRVFLELAVFDYLHRCGEMNKLIARLKAKNAMRPGFSRPALSQMVPEITRLTKAQLGTKAESVEKALRNDRAAPFTISDFNAFVHTEDFPAERDIRQFWGRTEPLFRLMLEQQLGEDAE